MLALLSVLLGRKKSGDFTGRTPLKRCLPLAATRSPSEHPIRRTPLGLNDISAHHYEPLTCGRCRGLAPNTDSAPSIERRVQGLTSQTSLGGGFSPNSSPGKQRSQLSACNLNTQSNSRKSTPILRPDDSICGGRPVPPLSGLETWFLNAVSEPRRAAGYLG